MSQLPVREMVLYKHGVGFFVRGGEVKGEQLSLTFRADELNDVLKSLTVLDQNGGQVLGVGYQTPMDIVARLASSSIHLSQQTSLRDLIRDLRGREVALEIEHITGEIEEVRGRVIGIDDPHQTNHRSGTYTADEILISLLVGESMVNVYPLHSLRSILILDSQSEHDLRYFLETSMQEDLRRTVHIRLSQGDHQLMISYVAPAPTWRVSYRIVAESEESGETGKALLQGWGLFDNRLEEDLQEVRLTLVAGQPISFIYDLYSSRIPERPTVQDEARVAPAPVEYDAAMAMDETAVMAAAPAAFADRMGTGGAPALRTRGIRKEVAAAAPPAAEGKEAGEFFQYAVTTPVSVKRGESALVPIIGSEVSYGRELLYNGAKLPDHPVAALRFQNSTGLTLERGPVTLVEDGNYKGEAIIPFTKDGNEVYVPYAVELGVKVTEQIQRRTQTIGLHIKDRALVYDVFQIQETTYTLENTTAKDVAILIEAPIQTGYEPFDMPAPEAETGTVRRWKVGVAARHKAKFTRQERYRTQHKIQTSDLTLPGLQQYLANQVIDEHTFQQLSGILELLAQVGRMEVEYKTLTAEKDKLYKQQEQLRENLKTLNAEGQEAALRNRMLEKLSATQDRLEAIDARQEELQGQIAASQAEIDRILDGLK
jgi:hypothetical protein